MIGIDMVPYYNLGYAFKKEQQPTMKTKIIAIMFV